MSVEVPAHLTPRQDPTFTQEQLSQYFEHISFPNTDLSRPPSLEYLTEIQKYQLATVPFENLTLHYSVHHRLSLDPHDLFAKVVGRRMGGYCMEANAFFGAILSSLGFQLFNAGGRVSDATTGRPGNRFMGW